MGQDLLPSNGLAKSEDPGTGLRIVAVDSDPAMSRFYQQTLPGLGHQVCVAGSGRQAVELCRLGQPDLVITELNLPDLDGFGVAAEVCRQHAIPFVVVSSRPIPDLSQRAPNGPFLACLVKPITAGELGPAIAVAMNCFRRLRSVWEEGNRLRQALDDRKLIERAKGLLMRYSGVGEEEAFHRLQKLASNEHCTLAEVAQRVVAAGEVFHQLEQAEERKRFPDSPARSARLDRPHRQEAGPTFAPRSVEHAS